MTRYIITIDGLGDYGELKISSAEFQDLRVAKHCVLFSLALEQTFDHVLENYFELEQCVLGIALKVTVFRGALDEILTDSPHSVTRRLVNFLTTARLYIDHALHGLSQTCGKDSSISLAAKQAAVREYDAFFGYRVMDALRNYVQHRGLPTYAISFKGSRDDSEEKIQLRQAVIPSLDVRAIKRDGGFKKQVLDEIEKKAGSSDRLSLLPLVREYVEGLGRIHADIRDLFGDKLSAADQAIESRNESYRAQYGEATALCAIQVDEGGRWSDKEYLVLKPVELRRQFARKNSHPRSLLDTYVTSKM
jgi:hypothetical protein